MFAPRSHDVPLGLAADAAWRTVASAAELAARLDLEGQPRSFAAGEDGAISAATPDARPALAWTPGSGWRSLLAADDPRSGLVSLYLPVCSATLARPITIGHLGQSLDGFIATHSGDSQFVTGDANVVHMHRLRALCDAIVVGAGTVAADDPQLTTRRVDGPNPLRVIVDPQRRLRPSARVFVDGAAPTLYCCSRTLVHDGEIRIGGAEVLGLRSGDDAAGQMQEVLAHLRARGCARVFVEGGGVTVSACLEADLLDRLHIAVAPVLIGDGRPAIRLSPTDRLRDCRRPAYRVFRMGGDVLFDCVLHGDAGEPAGDGDDIARII